MNELTIEEKAARYDKAIERARKIENGEPIDVPDGTHISVAIFPELKENESEDEKIRKAILWCITTVEKELGCKDAEGLAIAKLKSWVEKQGEQKSEHKKINDYRTWLNIVSKVLTEFQGIGQYLDNCICHDIAKMLQEKYCFDDTSADWDRVYRKGLDAGEVYGYNKAKKEQKPVWSDYDRDMLDNLIEDEYCQLDSEYISWFKDIKERFGNIEKMPANNVEPKFKVGDWIISNVSHEDYRICKILQIENGEYVIESIYGYKGHNNFETFDKDYHLWTIQDAKDGDILVDKYNNIGLYRKEKDDFWESYTYVGCNNCLYGSNIGGYHEHKNTVPATKEQRGLLFKKMEEAGYRWCSNKKDLRKC